MSVNKKEMALCFAAATGNYKKAEKMILQGANVNQTDKDKDKNTPLHLAAKGGHLDIVKLLVSNKAKIDLQNHRDITPLLYACQSDSVQTVEYLLAQGAKMQARSHLGNGPLHYAAKAGALNVLKFLIENKKLSPMALNNGNRWQGINNAGYDALMIAAQNGRLEVVRYLVNLGVSIYDTNYIGDSAFLLAAAHGHLSVVKFLLEQDKQGALLHSCNKVEMNALMVAVQSQSKSTVKFLIDQGINLSSTNIEEDTALDIAQENDYMAITAILQACLNLIHHSDMIQDPKLVKHLLNEGASVNMRAHVEYQTPLHCAVIAQNIPLVRALLDCGASPKDCEGRDKSGKNALELALQCDHIEAFICCLLQPANSALKLKQEKLAIEHIEHAFKEIQSLKSRLAQSEAYYFLGVELKNEIKHPKYAYQALMAVKQGTKYYEAARQELAELYLAAPVMMSESESLEDEDKKSSSEKCLSRALQFSLTSGHSEPSKNLRSRITNSVLGLGLSEANSIKDLATEEGVVDLLLQYKKLKSDFDKQQQEFFYLQKDNEVLSSSCIASQEVLAKNALELKSSQDINNLLCASLYNNQLQNISLRATLLHINATLPFNNFILNQSIVNLNPMIPQFNQTEPNLMSNSNQNQNSSSSTSKRDRDDAIPDFDNQKPVTKKRKLV